MVAERCNLHFRVLLTFAALSLLACNGDMKESLLKFQDRAFLVNEHTILDGDLREIIDPVWLSGYIWGTKEIYDLQLERFSPQQRHVYAILWYDAEVSNGGHIQFYQNPTGIVWRDVIDGFHAMGVEALHENVLETAHQFREWPSFVQDDRLDSIDEFDLDFGGNDDRYFRWKRENDLHARLLEYVRANAESFYVEAVLSVPVLEDD